MPYDDADAGDPMELRGVECETDDPGAIRGMAWCFIEEFLRMGVSPEQIVAIFAAGEYAGPALAVRRLGLDAVQEIVHQQIRLRGGRSPGTPTVRRPDGAVSLPVFEK